MITMREGRLKDSDVATEEPTHYPSEIQSARLSVWPVNWNAIWVGSLALVAAIIIFGLIGTALGAHVIGPDHRVVDLRRIAVGTLIFSIFSAFFASVIGGWVTGKIAGIRRSETAMLHGAVSWLVAIPLVITLGAVGAGSYLGGWHSGLASAPSWAARAEAPYDRPDNLDSTATDAQRSEHSAAMVDYHAKVRQWKDETPRATRNSALGAVSALLIGLVGSVVGGWMASGEPMTFNYHRTRDQQSSKS